MLHVHTAIAHRQCWHLFYPTSATNSKKATHMTYKIKTEELHCKNILQTNEMTIIVIFVPKKLKHKCETIYSSML